MRNVIIYAPVILKLTNIKIPFQNTLNIQFLMSSLLVMISFTLWQTQLLIYSF